MSIAGEGAGWLEQDMTFSYVFHHWSVMWVQVYCLTWKKHPSVSHPCLTLIRMTKHEKDLAVFNLAVNQDPLDINGLLREIEIQGLTGAKIATHC